MPRWILAVLFPLLAVPSFARTEPDDKNQLRWQAIFSARVLILEEKLGIRFDPGWRPTLVFGIPDIIPPQLRMGFGAQYTPETQSFAVLPTMEHGPDLSLIDHELGHALADQISRRTGNGMWPDIANYANLAWDEQTGINVISEGIGTYFEYSGGPPFPNDETGGSGWLPEGAGDLIWHAREYPRHGGRWLVAPIIKKYGERGIRYLVTHPLRFTDYNLRSAAQEYQRLAMEYLAKEQPVR